MSRLRHVRSAIVTIASLTALLALAGTASATHRGAGTIDEVVIRVSAQRAAVAGVSDQLMAQLTVDDGSSVSGVEVEFLRAVDFLGSRLISLGRATTDASGTARLPIQASGSSLRIEVRFAGNENFQPAEVTSEISLPAAPRPAPGEGEQPSQASLAVFGSIMPPVLAAMAAGVWLLLIGLSAITVRAIWRGRSSATRKEQRS